jgi:hypothetical protein
MNFLIFDNDLSSSPLINTLLADFDHVTLITSNESTSLLPSSFLSIKQGDMSNASDVIQSLSTHENDPYDAILLFNSSYTALINIIQTIKRLKRKFSHIFLVIVNEQNQFNENINKLLKESSAFLPWTVVNCQEITSSTTITTYQIETKSDRRNHQPISAINLLDFLRTELKTKKYLNEIIFFD